MRKLLIGFGHKRQRGKDTSAKYLAKKLYDACAIFAEIDAFAKPIKDVCATVFGFTDDQLNRADTKEQVDPFWGFTPRWALQTVGVEAFRNTIAQNIWVKSMERRFLTRNLPRIITDVRFVNEAQMVHRLGGYLIRCNRDVTYDSKHDDHPTETALDDWDDWDYELDNNGSKEHLEKQLIDILDGILKRAQ